MGWMSVNQFKRRFGFGRTLGETVPIYETFFSVMTEKGEIRLDTKKRYIRVLLNPDGAAVLINKKTATRMATAIEDQLEGPPPAGTGNITKDKNGIKIYAYVKDGQGIRVVVREADTNHVFLEATSIPHLREKDSWELVWGLRQFAKKAL